MVTGYDEERDELEYDYVRAVPADTEGSITIPSNLGGCPVTEIGTRAFYGCGRLTSVTIPSSVTYIGESAFQRCSGLADIRFAGMVAPVVGPHAFSECNGDLLLHAPEGWKGRSRFVGGCPLAVDGESGSLGATSVVVTVTNVVVQYVLNSIRPEFAVPPAQDTGFVNIITEVKGGAVAIPESWVENYPGFESKFGSDFSKALAMKTGKKDGAGNEMLVWQDYVAGTDPTDEKDVFTASITIVDG